ncbi:hypothetical protein MmiEs2_01480 [Methanimicrococcus stummii]|uniref:Uncharacterized protein n=1 Tax=Methanimicrococcus stummii TaxID=3028294 RepID=A0AA96V771_9EURY|nr:hypothetical protein [Methanimicrococcus sp. Es2]WNY27969.1 hypothetical protein MmiEs2_01480 [Methanimicrococcus sp. Es2]
MEIDDVFLSLEEIQTILENDGCTWRIAADDDDIEEEDDCDLKIDLKTASFSADADTTEIEKWEAELPDSDENNEDEENEKENQGETVSKSGNETNLSDQFENAAVIYFDIFKKRTYTQTLIFQKEDENGKRIYRLIGFCDAPMC